MSVFVSSILARKSPANSWFPSEKAMFFKTDLQCFGPLSKFQRNIPGSVSFLVTMMKGNYHFISNNVKRTNASEKRVKLFRYVRYNVSNNGFLFLQETHSS